MGCRLRFTLFSALLVSTAVAAPACSSSSSSSGGQTPNGFTASYCALVTPCCGKLGRPTDGAACQAFTSAFATGERYDPNAGNACLAQMNAKSSDPQFCDALFGSDSTAIDLSACNGVFSAKSNGTVAPGGECNNTSDCAPSTEGKVDCAYGFSSSGGTIKKCQVQIKGKSGDSPCIGTVDGNITSFSTSSDVAPRGYLCNVADGIYCDTTTQACTPQGAIGATCNSSTTESCVKGAYCDFATKTCIARVATGGACTGTNCVSGDYCDSTSSTCMEKVANGQPCADGSKCASGSCVNSKCAPSSGLGAALLCGGG